MSDYAKRLGQAISEMASPVRNAEADVKKYKYKYATLEQVAGIVQPALMKHDLFFTQGVFDSEDGAKLVTQVVDSTDGNFVVVDSRPLKLEGDAQRDGSMETYMRRYALMTAFALAPTDDDGAAASGDSRQPVPAPKQEDELLKQAKTALYESTKRYADSHNADHKKVMEGIMRRPEYPDNKENPGWFWQVAREFDSAMERGI